MRYFLLLLFCLSSTVIFAANNNDSPDIQNTYAMDKLANAEAQLNKLKSQRKAINELIQAVSKDLQAAKIRAKAEKLQAKADTERVNAAGLVEQTGLAIDLPNLMNESTRPIERSARKNDELDLMFKDKGSKSASVFFPGNGRKVEANNSSLPDYIK